jgi:hypothetical protein
MNATEKREELHQFIDRADERILNRIYDFIRTRQHLKDIPGKPVHEKLLDDRLEAAGDLKKS